VTDTRSGLLSNPLAPFVDPALPSRARSDADRKYWFKEYYARRTATNIYSPSFVHKPPQSHLVYRGPLENSPRRIPPTPPLSVPFNVLAAALTNLGLQDQISVTSLYDVLKKEVRSRGLLPGASSHHTSSTSNQPPTQK
jgi:hypothetical protein